MKTTTKNQNHIISPLSFREGFLVWLFLLLLISTTSVAQSWQWGVRGGGQSNVDNNNFETVQSMATDSHKNIYMTTTISADTPNVDGHDLNTTDLGQGINPSDGLLASFGCDGSYRWSKIFTGQDRETLKYVHTDAQDNVYVVGYAIGGGGNNNFIKYPNVLDTDVTFPQSIAAPDYCIAFVVKYNSNGQFQWLTRMRPANATTTLTSDNQVKIFGYNLDSAGTSYVWAGFCPGTYFNGNLTVTGTGYKNYIITIDTNGNFVSAHPLDIQFINGGYTYLDDILNTFYRNPNNGYFYFVGHSTSSSETINFAGNSPTHRMVIACFNPLGQFQYMREDTRTDTIPWITLNNMTFDSDNNVYMTFQFGGNGNNPPPDSFLGFSIPVVNDPLVVMKTDPLISSRIWTSNTDFLIGSNQNAGLIVNGNEVGVSNFCFNGFYWGSQNLGTTWGVNPLLARLNKTTGECIGLSYINTADTQTNNGDVLVADASGDYIMGGKFSDTLIFDNNQVITNSGTGTDFFVAKFSTQACSALGVNEVEKPKIKAAPNPAQNHITLTIDENKTYTIYDENSRLVAKGILTILQNTIDVANLGVGTYILNVQNSSGNNQVIRFIKD